MDEKPIQVVLEHPAGWIVARDVAYHERAALRHGLVERREEHGKASLGEIVEQAGRVDELTLAERRRQPPSGQKPADGLTNELEARAGACPDGAEGPLAICDRELLLVDERDIQARTELRMHLQQLKDLSGRPTADARNPDPWAVARSNRLEDPLIQK